MTPNNAISKSNRVTVLAVTLLTVFFLLVLNVPMFAQENVEINGQDVGSWFQRNWMWVTGGVVLLLLILLLSSRSSSRARKTTTVIKDSYGNVKSVTTTEEKP
jgi:hypothetical protein